MKKTDKIEVYEIVFNQRFSSIVFFLVSLVIYFFVYAITVFSELITQTIWLSKLLGHALIYALPIVFFAIGVYTGIRVMRKYATITTPLIGICLNCLWLIYYIFSVLIVQSGLTA